MLGILGGTFDPIHLGHMKMAEIALEELKLNKLIMLPSGDPPHKKANASAKHRLNMVQIACKNNKKLTVSKIEIDRGGLTYTLDTLHQILSTHPDEQIVLIVGSDSLHTFPTWHEPQQIAKLCTLAVVLRDEDPWQIKGIIKDLSKRYNLKVHLFKSRGIKVSSTQIRQMIQENKDAGSLLPEGVYEYIRTNKLYKNHG